jgi:hypothetical protein
LKVDQLTADKIRGAAAKWKVGVAPALSTHDKLAVELSVLHSNLNFTNYLKFFQHLLGKNIN